MNAEAIDYRVGLIERTDRARVQACLRDLEATSSYPLGGDRFRVNHGSDYFAFFDRLGEARTYTVWSGQDLVATGTSVLRRLPGIGGRTRSGWYACDVKVHPAHRRRGVALRMLAHAFPRIYARCARGYGIAMLPAGGGRPPILDVVERFGPLAGISQTRLLLCSLPAERMLAAEPIVRRHRGPLGYLSHAGCKDIVLESTGCPMPLLHVQFGPCAEPAIAAPQDGAVHMFCAPAGDLLWAELAPLGVVPDAAAAIIGHRMDGTDWSFVLTSDI